jgi:hypothetical protein
LNKNPLATDFCTRAAVTYGQFKSNNDAKLKAFEETSGFLATVLWECDFISQKRNGVFAYFEDILYKERPNERLDPQKALRAPVAEIFNHTFNKEDDDDDDSTTFYALDCVSAYTKAALTVSIPCQENDMLIGAVLEQVTEENGVFILNGAVICGLAHAKIVAPITLAHPFLPHKICLSSGEERSILSLCHKCTIDTSSEPCKHSEDQRSFTSVYTTLDLAYAVKIGYQILEFYEIWRFKSSSRVLAGISTVLFSQKVKASNPPPDQPLKEFLADVNQRLGMTKMNQFLTFFCLSKLIQCFLIAGLHPTLLLTPENVSFCPHKRENIKNLINIIYGMLVIFITTG